MAAPSSDSSAGLRTEVVQKVAALATAAFGLVAALAWNSLIQGLFARYYAPGEALGGLFVYALVVTVVAVAVTIWIGRASARLKAERRLEEQDEERDGRPPIRGKLDA